MKSLLRATFLLMLVAWAALFIAPPQRAAAHPMGNFTINHYSALTIGTERVDVLYVVDMAEIPAYQELATIRPDHGTELTPEERNAYTTRKASDLLPGLSLQVGGKNAELTLVGRPDLSFPPGAGDLPTLRLELRLQAALGGAQGGTIEYRDDNSAGRIGWKEIIAKPGEGVTITNASVPTKDKSDALRAYPVDLLNSPSRVSSATVSFSVGGADRGRPVAVEQVTPQEGGSWGSLEWVRQQTDAITGVMRQKEAPIGALLVALSIAFSVGAAHALSPGHGKTVVAAYLVGSRGTAMHAMLLGLTVTISHTLGVFLLGLAVLYLADYILPETLYPWLSFLSGALLVAMGIALFVQRRRAWKRGLTLTPTRDEHDHDGHAHSHAQDEHEHDHVHDHAGDEHARGHGHGAAEPHSHGPFGRPHTHLPADGQKVTLGNLLVLGITGGIIPCPSALVVLLVAIASGQVGLGLLLILAFSLGLAVVLMAIGMLVVYSRRFLDRFPSRGGRLGMVLGRLPMFSALAVTVLGVLIAFSAFTTR